MYYYNGRDDDDLDAFQRGLPADNYGGVGVYRDVFQNLEICGTNCLTDQTLFPSADLSAFPIYSPPFPVHPSSTSGPPHFPSPSPSSASLTRTPLAIAAICRRIHSTLTGPKALRRAEEHGVVDAHGMRDIWHDLDRCWGELEARRRSVQAQDPNDAGAADRGMEVDQYVSAWQVRLFHFIANPCIRCVGMHMCLDS